MRARFTVAWGSSPHQTYKTAQWENTDRWQGDLFQLLKWIDNQLQALRLSSGGVLAASNKSPRLNITVFAQSYRLQKSKPGSATNSLQFELLKRRNLTDWLLGRDTFGEDDAFVRLLQDVLEREFRAPEATIRVSWL